MNFVNVQVLGASSSSQFFGDQVRWKSVLDITVEGSFLSPPSTQGVSNIHGQVNSFENSAFGGGTFYSTITINGVNFGEGYVNNFSASPEGPDVIDKKYTASITIPRQGNLSTLAGAEFATTFTNFEFVENFTESSVFTKGEGVKDSYNQSVSLSISPKVKGNGRSFAETIIKSFLNNNNLTSLVAAQYQQTNIKKYYEQSYDTINNSYICNANFELYTRSTDSTPDLLVNRNARIEYNPDGTITASENGEIIGNKSASDPARYADATTKAKQLISSAFSRLNGLVPSTTHNPLINQILNRSVTALPFEGRVNYSVSFTNSLETVLNKGYWSFSVTVDENEGGEFVLTENGSIIGKDPTDLAKRKFTNAQTLFDSEVKSGIKNRLEEEYPGQETLKLLSSSETSNEVDGSIEYSYAYTDSESVLENATIRKIVTTITQDFDRILFSTFNIMNLKEIAQKQPNKFENKIVIDINMNGKFTTTLGDYVSRANTIIEDNKPGDFYISDASYSHSPSNREFNLTATYFTMPQV